MLLRGERLILECKLAESNVPKSIWETYSAFANTIGGTILLGIKENKNETTFEKKFEIVGVNNAARSTTIS